MPVLRVAFEPVPLARWGSLFHVLRLERPDVQLEWIPLEFAQWGQGSLDGADVGLLLEPPSRPGFESLTVASTGMVVLMAAGHRLARHHELQVAEVLDEPFPDPAGMAPAWRAFWALDAYR